jgi:phasin family protein
MAKQAKKATKTPEFEAEIFSADKIQENIQKAVSSFGDVNTFGKDTVEAVVESATIASKGIEAFNAETAAFGKEAFEASSKATKDAFSAKSVQEFVEIQSEFSKSFFENYVAQSTKIAEMFTTASNEAAEPINARVNAFVEKVQGA